jgi:hypothetical protein
MIHVLIDRDVDREQFWLAHQTMDHSSVNFIRTLEHVFRMGRTGDEWMDFTNGQPSRTRKLFMERVRRFGMRRREEKQ